MERKKEKLQAGLDRCKLLGGCSTEDVQSILNAPGVVTKSYSQGEYLMQRNSTKHVIGILQKGQAVVERKTENGMMHMSRISVGDVFGAASVFCSEASYVVDIRCLTDCDAVLIPEATLLELLSKQPTLLQNYLRYLTGRIRFLNRRLDALSKNNVPAKLMSHFVSESENGTVRVKSYTELAESLCLSRATLYRALDSLAQDGRIQREGKKITVLEEYFE